MNKDVKLYKKEPPYFCPRFHKILTDFNILSLMHSLENLQ